MEPFSSKHFRKKKHPEFLWWNSHRQIMTNPRILKIAWANRSKGTVQVVNLDLIFRICLINFDHNFNLTVTSHDVFKNNCNTRGWSENPVLIQEIFFIVFPTIAPSFSYRQASAGSVSLAKVVFAKMGKASLNSERRRTAERITWNRLGPTEMTH